MQARKEQEAQNNLYLCGATSSAKLRRRCETRHIPTYRLKGYFIVLAINTGRALPSHLSRVYGLYVLFKLNIDWFLGANSSIMRFDDKLGGCQNTRTTAAQCATKDNTFHRRLELFQPHQAYRLLSRGLLCVQRNTVGLCSYGKL